MRFFFYGTLVASSDNCVARTVHARLRPLGPARVCGLLHAIPDPRGWYPALLPGEGEVHGIAYEALAGFTSADLALIDAYEDHDPARPADSLYIRAAISATCGEVQAYRYNRALPEGARPIPGGHFGDWLVATGFLPFAANRSE